MTVAHTPRRWHVFSTLVIALLAVAGTVLGLFRDGFYTDPDVLLYQAYGQDTVTLVFVVPLLLGGLLLARRGSLRGTLLWLGALAYLAYTYAVYAVITQFNPFFLGYVALFGLSTYTLVGGLFDIDPKGVERRLEGTLRVRLLAGFFVVMGVLVALLWLSEVIPATLANETPESIAGTGLPANVVHVLDLGILIPALGITAWWLLDRRPWGYVLPGVFFVKLTSIGVAIIAMIVWMQMEGQAVQIEEIVVFVVLTVANATFGILYFRSFESPDEL